MKLIILFLSLLFMFSGCLKEESPFIPISGIEPEEINDGWATSTPAVEGMDENALLRVYEDIYEEASLIQLRSLLVIKNEKLVAENYFKDPGDINTQRPIWSCTKQIMGLLAGKALEQGHLNSLEDPLSQFLSQELKSHPDKSAITIRNLLTMQSGIDFDETKDVATLLQQKPANTLDFILGLPILESPGLSFNYNSGDPHLLAASIQNEINRPLTEWAKEALFSKIGFNNYSWLAYDGYNYGGYGISTTPRELGKIAQLVLNKGIWKGEQIVKKTWINDMVSTQVNLSIDSEYSFGFLWWINEAEGIYFMSGSGGQYACVVPDKNLIIVAMSEHDTDGDLEIDFDTFLSIVKEIRATVY